jgi:hypothetical protein
VLISTAQFGLGKVGLFTIFRGSFMLQSLAGMSINNSAKPLAIKVMARGQGFEAI